MHGYDFEPKTKEGNFIQLKKKGDTVKIRLVSTPFIFNEAYEQDGIKTITQRFAWIVIDRSDKKVKSFKGGTQIYKAIKSFASNEDWGDPMMYDLTITRTEEKGNYYTVIASPNKYPISDDEKNKIAIANIDLEKRYGKFAVKIEEDENTKFLNENDREHNDLEEISF